MDRRKGRLIIVSNRLPVSVQMAKDGIKLTTATGGLVSAINGYLEQVQNAEHNLYDSVIWVGVPDCSRSDWERAKSAIAESSIKYLPVFLDKTIKDAFYNRFSNSTLWPLFHYFTTYSEFDESDYMGYQLANERFADEVLRELKPEDTLWIHDYHLLPLPGLIRAGLPDARIGFFLHIPFPSFEIFRLMPSRWRWELLNGMLGADLVGFHTPDDVIYFLESVQRFIGLTNTSGRVLLNHRQIQVGTFPISINFNKFNDASKSEDAAKSREAIKAQTQDKQIIFSVDRLDYTKGVLNRLEAYEYFLRINPQYKEKVVFIMNIVPSRDIISKYSERKKMIDEFVGGLNAQLGNISWQPVLYQYKHLSFDELLGLYTACDVAMITPMRDGMNLVAKEFIASRSDEKGVLILSELAGSAKELTNALLINPNDYERIALKLRTALDMTEQEQKIRLRRMREYLASHDVFCWANEFFKSLDEVKVRQEKFYPKVLTDGERSAIQKAYTEAKSRLILMDYDGTLVPIVSHPDLAVPSQELIELLGFLCAQTKNTVFIISGRKRENLERWFGNLNIGLVAEHGAFIRWPGKEWTTHVVPAQEWKRDAVEVMKRFTAVYPGSWMEEKEYAMAWHFRNLEEHIARRASRELYYQLYSITSKPSAEVIQGNKVVEIRSRGANKGAAFADLTSSKDFDFVLAAGDDRTDEDLFERLTKPHEYSIRVGGAASHARFNLNSAADILELLMSLSESDRTTLLQHASGN